MGGPDMAPHPPPTLGAPMLSRWRSSISRQARLGPGLLPPEPERAKRGLVVELEETGRRGRRRVPVLPEIARPRHGRVALLPPHQPRAHPCLAAPREPAINGA